MPRIVLFSGGTACRSINLALSRMSAKVTRIVPAWDSGGSSKALREAFGMLPVGDIRQALMTMAHGEGRAGGVVRICNARLSDGLGEDDARGEFEFYAGSGHPLLRRMEPILREAIVDYLRLFRQKLPSGFDFRNGSIGNFILAGAYFAHRSDINAAIREFRSLCGISGNVWPASTLPDVQLVGTLKDGRILDRQHLVTKMNEADAAIGLAGIELKGGAAVTANGAVIEAVENADVIVFGPGSFYTSILPHLLVGGIAEAVAGNRHAPRVLVANILQCAETQHMDLAGQVGTFVQAGLASTGEPLLTHVLSNSELFPFEKTVGRFSYLRHGNLDEVCKTHGIVHASEDIEDPWARGQHDGRAVGGWLMHLAAAGRPLA